MNVSIQRLSPGVLGLAASVAVPVLCASPGVAVDAGAQTIQPERIAINDNRMPAGTLERGLLTVHLEAREGEWHPDGDTQPGINVLAFAVDGAPLQIPGPLIRVTDGTEVRAFVRNPLDREPIILHGMSGRTASPSSAADAITIAPGEVREIRFVAAVPGTYFYWAATSDVQLALRSPRDSQLSGAFIVGPKGAAERDERVFLIGV